MKLTQLRTICFISVLLIVNLVVYGQQVGWRGPGQTGVFQRMASCSGLLITIRNTELQFQDSVYPNHHWWLTIK
jgi:hypothetical protein